MAIGSDGYCGVTSIVALITAAWLHTPRGVEKGSCLNRPAKDVIVKSVEIDNVAVMNYKDTFVYIYILISIYW